MAEKTPQEVEFDKAKKYGGDTRSRMKTAYGKIRAAAEAGDLALCRKLLDDFKAEASKLPGIYARMQRAVEAFKRMVAEGAAPASAAAVVFPNDLEGLVDGGSAELDGAARSKVTDASGRVWFKRTKDDAAGGMEQLESETAADAVYAGFGIMTPASRMYGDAKLTEDVGGVPLAAYLEGSASDAEKEAARRQFVEGLDVDCMLANWSCVGGNDRRDFAVIRDGKVYRTATYGAMAFRVKGGKKGSGGWCDDPTDYFKLWTYGNQQAVLDGEKVSALDLMRKTIGRNWDGALAKLPEDERKIVEKRLENVRKLVAYGDELQKEDPHMTTGELNDALQEFMENKYKKPRKLTDVKPDMSKKRVEVSSTDQTKKTNRKIDLSAIIHGRSNLIVKGENVGEPTETGYTEEIVHALGMDGLPQIAQNAEEYEQACKASGWLGERGVGCSDDDMKDRYIGNLKNGDAVGDFYIKCYGYHAYGYGLYIHGDFTGGTNRENARKCERDAWDYTSNAYDDNGKKIDAKIGVVYRLSVAPDFKWANYYDLQRMQQKEKDRELRQLDVSAYGALKGFDGLKAHDEDQCYCVVWNRTKLVMDGTRLKRF